jgi:hypothetical protein
VAQFVTEIEQANLSGFSPTEVFLASTADRSVERTKDPNFDPRKQVVLREPIAAKLVPAKNSQFLWGKDGARFPAESDGISLVVLPVRNSKCICQTRHPMKKA